ncbi:hypothetical protein Sjap_000705 [Stephania japonica]|uniref:Uncharacterized protein n=1 Tax=Stephania japonica TaxID=461633 RepID=A0AAP0KL73_9MAGN
MQSPSLQFSPSTLFPTLPLLLFPLPTKALFPNRHRSFTIPPIFDPSTSSNRSNSTPFGFPPLHCTVTELTVEASRNEAGFIEVGHISGVHGLGGELRVKPNTGYPELRFSKPGRRWLKERVGGKEAIREVELVEGREHPGQKCWIVSFQEIDSVEKAKELIGSTLLVSEDDRPVLEEGEYYTRDLVGMSVILKDTSELVGTVINVFNTGASDLLEVMLNSAEKTNNGTASSNTEASVSGPLVLVPFVKAIVPDIDMDKREMQITPPKGLLELNVKTDERSKKERRQLEWKQRKRAAKRLIAAKKKLSEMEQKHVFHGLRFGEKAQRSLLAEQVVGINLTLFKPALDAMGMPSKRVYCVVLVRQVGLYLEDLKKKKGSATTASDPLTKTLPQANHDGYVRSLVHDVEKELHLKGLDTISKGKTATILIIDEKAYQGRESDHGSPGCIQSSSNISYLEELFCNDEQFFKIEDKLLSLPLVIVSSANEIQSLQKLFSDNNYFGFDAGKVWFLEEEELPVVSSSLEDNAHKILMKSPWEILRSSVGSGGVFSLVSSSGILQNFSEMDIDYVQVCSLGSGAIIGSPLFFGFIQSHNADIGLLIDRNEDFVKDFNMIFSMRFLKKFTKQTSELEFHAIEKQNSHVVLVDKEWVEVNPSSPNSYEIHSSIYGSLNACSPDKICAMKVID